MLTILSKFIEKEYERWWECGHHLTSLHCDEVCFKLGFLSNWHLLVLWFFQFVAMLWVSFVYVYVRLDILYLIYEEIKTWNYSAFMHLAFGSSSYQLLDGFLTVCPPFHNMDSSCLFMLSSLKIKHRITQFIFLKPFGNVNVDPVRYSPVVTLELPTLPWGMCLESLMPFHCHQQFFLKITFLVMYSQINFQLIEAGSYTQN